jgi:hypothetical protein
MYELYSKADYKQMITIKCPSRWSKEDFRAWWFEHADSMKKLPGLKWYTILFSLDESPFGPPAFEGFEELWFGSLEDLKAAFITDIMKGELANIRKNGFDDASLFQAAWLEENIIPLKGYENIPDKRNMVRLTGICKHPPSMTKKDLKDWFYQHAARVIDEKGYMIIPGIRWYTHSFAMDESPFGPPPFYGCAENWWENLEAMKRDFEGEVMKSQLEDREGNIDIVDPSYFQGIWADEHIIDIPGK